MGKKGGKNTKRLKLKSITPPDSDSGALKTEETSLGLTLGPLKLVAKSPFNTPVHLADTIALVSKDNVEFLVSRSLLSFASAYFKKVFSSLDEPSDGNDQLGLEQFSILDWEVFAVAVDEDSTAIDALLRFVYPIPSPVFKEPVNEHAVTELPFRLMGPIYYAAKRYEFSYVCQRILDIAHELIYIKAFPDPGLSSLRAYGVACRLKLDYETRLKAARNALCVPFGSPPMTGLAGEGVSSADIQRFADFHEHAFQACHNLLSVNSNDAYPVGLSDVYACFVACTYCCGVPAGGNVMRCGAARWWQLYAANALEKLRRAPLSPSIFFEDFLIPVFREAQNCHACASIVHWKWCNMMPMLAQTIPARIYEIGLGDEGDEETDTEIEGSEAEVEQTDPTL